MVSISAKALRDQYVSNYTPVPRGLSTAPAVQTGETGAGLNGFEGADTLNRGGYSPEAPIRCMTDITFGAYSARGL